MELTALMTIMDTKKFRKGASVSKLSIKSNRLAVFSPSVVELFVFMFGCDDFSVSIAFLTEPKQLHFVLSW